ncbi:FAD binding domain-containing protein [Roseomonas populi]|uniref:FAD binding domain-containing protein n=1 Tax=Roseomonas populi TaxID=3121582 RepID=A0ABT1X9T2_9PROT|nr:FAD binding domain-containing protein [Roseomonas pecuniae]MCR0984862.1 FAD binding domain-containing protein [Roseomonas pecuniae]
MIGARFRFKRPETLEEALDLLAGAGGLGRVIGGGSVLVPALVAGQDAPALVVDIGRLGLGSVREEGSDVVIGAAATYATLLASEVVRRRLPLLAAMLREVTGGPGLWNLATPGGAACYANPASDVPGCLVALGAAFRLASRRGERLVAAENFFRGAFETERLPDEMLTALVLPAPEPGRHAYYKLKHAGSSWPIVTASCLSINGGIRLCLGGAAPVPLLLDWPTPSTTEAVAAMAEQAQAAIATEWTDELAGPGYRRAVVPVVAARAIRAVLEERTS